MVYFNKNSYSTFFHCFFKIKYKKITYVLVFRIKIWFTSRNGLYFIYIYIYKNAFKRFQKYLQKKLVLLSPSPEKNENRGAFILYGFT